MQNLPEVFVFLLVVTLSVVFFTALAMLSDAFLRYTCNRRLFPKDYFK